MVVGLRILYCVIIFIDIGFPVLAARKHLRYDVPLDQKGILHLFWDVDYETDTVTFRLDAKISRNGWLGFGFSDYGEAHNADMVFLWRDMNGKRHFQDTHTDHNGIVSVDKRQDYKLQYVERNGPVLSVTFSRIFDTCDNNDYIIDGGTTHIIYVLGKRKLMTVEGMDISKFKVGLQRAQFLKSQLPIPHLPKDTKVMDMTVENVHVPDAETTYWCYVRKLPELKAKHHIIQFEGIITPGNEGLVHHMEVFHCEVPEEMHVPDYDAPCSGEMKPKKLEFCRKVLGAWAMGAKPLALPSEAGYPVGGPGFSRYVMMEVHFNNPDRKQGMVDSSGIRFYYTSELRKYDAGTMELGLEYIDKMALPPRQPIWKLKGYCIPECTKVGLPADGIQVFASQLHTHLTGKAVYTKHYRDGIELPELNRDDHYSPHFQEIRILKKPVTVLPGDALITTCEDSTIARPNITMGGFAISEEMCVNYVHYYPLIKLEVCKSSIDSKALGSFFKFMNDYVGQPTSTKKGISDNYKSIEWTPINVDLLRTLYNTAPLSMQCNQSSGARFPGYWENAPLPKINFPLPPTERPCLV